MTRSLGTPGVKAEKAQVNNQQGGGIKKPLSSAWRLDMPRVHNKAQVSQTQKVSCLTPRNAKPCYEKCFAEWRRPRGQISKDSHNQVHANTLPSQGGDSISDGDSLSCVSATLLSGR